MGDLALCIFASFELFRRELLERFRGIAHLTRVSQPMSQLYQTFFKFFSFLYPIGVFIYAKYTTKAAVCRNLLPKLPSHQTAYVRQIIYEKHTIVN